MKAYAMSWFSGIRGDNLLSRFRYAWAGVLLLVIPLQDTRPLKAQVEYARAYQLFMHGALEKSQLGAAHGYGRFLRSDPEWASKFQLLEARAMVARGMYEDALRLLSVKPSIINTREGLIEKLTLEGVAFTLLPQFALANQKLTEAQNLCKAASYAVCGGVSLRRGLLASKLGHPTEAQQLFLESLSVARKHQDGRVETNALLNLGYESLQNEHYDEAVNWLASANRAAAALGAEDLVQIISGNLGWAYFKLGDVDRALELILEAEKDAVSIGDLRAEINWGTTAGFIYTRKGEIELAKRSYQQALQQARQINSQQDISDILTDLALVALATAKPAEAEAYAQQALTMAQRRDSRADALDAIAMQMQAAAMRGDTSRAEQLLQEVENSPQSQTSMKWASEDSIARLYESQGRTLQAKNAYESALKIFEAARAELYHAGLQIPFLANATRIYDDYIHFLVTQGKTDQALVVADQSRARTLAQGLEENTNQRAVTPVSLPPQAVARKAGATLLFYWLGENQSYLWAITPEKTVLFTLPAQNEITPLVERYRKVLLGTQDPLESDNTTGQELYTMLVGPATKVIRPGVPVMVLTDGALSQLNFETLIVPGEVSGTDMAKLSNGRAHYWIEDATLMAAPSLTMLAATKPVRETSRNLLLLGDAVSPNAEYPELPFASMEMQEIEQHFAAHEEVVFGREQATPSAYLASNPAQFSYIHFVSHGVASRADPLDSAIILSRSASPDASTTRAEDSFKLYAREVMRHPIDARLVTISACYGSGTRTYAGEGLVGLSWAFLRAGAHNVVGALWEASDESSPRLMDRMYQGLQDGSSPDTALRIAKLSLLHSSSKFRKPYYWAPFQIYTRL
jgi:CHAT domain-containing protein